MIDRNGIGHNEMSAPRILARSLTRRGSSARLMSSASRIDIFCQKCTAPLYRYTKRGKGALVKCLERRIVQDFTNGDLTCPGCGSVFARRYMYKGQPAHKIIGGKVFWK